MYKRHILNKVTQTTRVEKINHAATKEKTDVTILILDKKEF